MHIHVIGAGVAGLSFALAVTAAGYQNVLVSEEHSRVGIPKHCTGLVSETTVQAWGSIARNCVVRKFREYVVRDMRGQNVIYLELLEPVYLLDRVKLEEELADAVLSAGGIIKFRHKVRVIHPHHNILIDHKGNHIEYDIAVVCEGAPRVLARSLSLYSKPRNLVGIQRLILLDKSPETVIVYADRRISRNFFGWCVPFTDKIALIGTADRHGSSAYAGVLRILHVLEREGYYVRGILERFGGLIPIDSPHGLVADNNVLFFGDAASLVKPLTGGGLYAISRVFRALTGILKYTDPEELPHAFMAEVSMFKRKFRFHNVIRSVLIALGGYETALKVFSATGVHSVKIRKYDDLLTSMKLSFR